MWYVSGCVHEICLSDLCSAYMCCGYLCVSGLVSEYSFVHLGIFLKYLEFQLTFFLILGF